VVAVSEVVDGIATSVGVGLAVDVANAVLRDVEAGTGSATAPIAAKVTIEPSAEAGIMTFLRNRGALENQPAIA
jgi:hypothetical protein